MTNILVDDCIDALAQYLLGKKQLRIFPQIGLYVNNLPLTIPTHSADFLECSAPGYSPIDLAPAAWQGGTTNGLASYLAPTATFAITGQGSPPQTVYGWFVRDKISGLILFAGPFARPWPIPATNIQNPSITPLWTSKNCT